MRSLREKITTPVREGTKGADKNGIMEQHTKKTLRYKVEKRVHGSEEKAGLVVSISLKVSRVRGCM